MCGLSSSAGRIDPKKHCAAIACAAIYIIHKKKKGEQQSLDPAATKASNIKSSHTDPFI
jgi:hypothetical protein